MLLVGLLFREHDLGCTQEGLTTLRAVTSSEIVNKNNWFELSSLAFPFLRQSKISHPPDTWVTGHEELHHLRCLLPLVQTHLRRKGQPTSLDREKESRAVGRPSQPCPLLQ